MALETTGNATPTTEFECKFSTPYCVAVALLTGRARTEAFAGRWREDAALRKLMGRVDMEVDAESEAAFPARRGAIVEVGTVAGERLVKRCPTRKGDPDNPLSHEESIEKFRELVEPVIGRDAGDTLLSAIREIERIADMAELPVVPPGPAAVRAQGAAGVRAQGAAL